MRGLLSLDLHTCFGMPHRIPVMWTTWKALFHLHTRSVSKQVVRRQPLVTLSRGFSLSESERVLKIFRLFLK